MSSRPPFCMHPQPMGALVDFTQFPQLGSLISGEQWDTFTWTFNTPDLRVRVCVCWSLYIWKHFPLKNCGIIP